jgi:hypothetical protein
MPHVVLEKANNIEEVYDALSLFSQKTEDGILKIMDKYINTNKNSILLESLAIENGQNQNFFIQVSKKQDNLTVRLLPLTDPEKTKGVKTLMAKVAKQIKDTNETIHYGKNNLEAFLL